MCDFFFFPLLSEPSAPGDCVSRSVGRVLSSVHPPSRAPCGPRRLPGRTSLCGFSLEESLGDRPGERESGDSRLSFTGYPVYRGSLPHCLPVGGEAWDTWIWATNPGWMPLEPDGSRSAHP